MRFSIRLEEGYDLIDPKYEAWLRIHYPESAGKAEISKSPIFMNSSKVTDSSLSMSGLSCIGGSPSTSHSIPNQGAQVTPKSTSLAKSDKCSPLSDLPNLPKVTTPVTSKSGRAHVLTSSECLRLLKEKEEKKQQVVEEKERKKQEREMKKQQKEQEQKRKAEEKARKLAKREAEKARKQAEKEEKANKKAEKAKEKTDSKKEVVGAKRKADSSTSERASQHTKRRRMLGDLDEDISMEVCCVCYGTYLEDVNTGRQWLECSCSGSIHEDCIDDDDVDSDGKLCPLC